MLDILKLTVYYSLTVNDPDRFKREIQMFTLNIYATPSADQPNGAYLFSISKNTRKECMAIANQKYAGMAWDWDDKNYVRNKKFNADPASTTSINLLNAI